MQIPIPYIGGTGGKSLIPNPYILCGAHSHFTVCTYLSCPLEHHLLTLNLCNVLRCIVRTSLFCLKKSSASVASANVSYLVYSNNNTNKQWPRTREVVSHHCFHLPLKSPRFSVNFCWYPCNFPCSIFPRVHVSPKSWMTLIHAYIEYFYRYVSSISVIASSVGSWSGLLMTSSGVNPAM